MPRRFVRESKFRHVFGSPYKKAQCYENIDISKNSWDGGSYCAVNSKFLAIVLEGYGGGCFIVLPIDKTGRIEKSTPKVEGHKGKVLDIQFNPFNTNIIASSAEDSRIKIWKIPEGGLKTDLKESVIDLVGHRKKVGIIQWHPTANNILASAGSDNDLIVWDVENGSPVHVISCHSDVINCLTWSKNGSHILTTCKDKTVRVLDPRKEEVLHEFKAHEGNKPARAFFVDETRILTVGCSRQAEREIRLWDTAALEEPITTHELDHGSGSMLAFYDDILNILYVAAKGDCNIRYFEISKEDPYIHYLSQHSSTTPQRSFGVLPKRAVNVNLCEIFRLYKLSSKNICEPISMVVPRKSDCFQPDIYPNVPGDTPALTAEEWFGGQDENPILISLKDGFVATEKEFTVKEDANKDENIFAANLQTAPKREEDLRKAFYQQQDELQKLRDLLKGKELRIRKLEYENKSLKKNTATTITYNDVIENNEKRSLRKEEVSSMLAEDSDGSDGSSVDQTQTETNSTTTAESTEVEAC